MTEAAPTPMPPTARHRIMSHGPNASPEPMALTVKSTAASTMTRMRPMRSASAPAR